MGNGVIRDPIKSTVIYYTILSLVIHRDSLEEKSTRISIINCDFMAFTLLIITASE